MTIDIVARPRASVSISSSAYGCEGVPQLYVAAPVNGGPGPLFQWKLNGFSTGGASADSSFMLPAPVSTDVVSCVMTSNETCVSNPVVVSNSITVPVEPVPVTGVDMTASADHVCEDSLVVFGARPINGGSSPAFGWLVNGKVVDSSGPVYATRSLKNGDVVGLAMRGSLTCSQLVRAPEVVSMTVWDAPTIALFLTR
ncbi:hypothetical protein ACQ86N_04595 [Puia sp. P3]|uniref:hypothetical protein n=1 Tax=Puia sp. P3 TaxID=3423952 RepID=UPI003D6724DC